MYMYIIYKIYAPPILLSEVQISNLHPKYAFPVILKYHKPHNINTQTTNRIV